MTQITNNSSTKEKKSEQGLVPLAYFQTTQDEISTQPEEWKTLLHDYSEPLILTEREGTIGLYPMSQANDDLTSDKTGSNLHPVYSIIPAITPEKLGSQRYKEVHGVKYCYVAGAMANGICSEEIVISMAKAGMIGFFGAGGLALDRVSEAIDKIQKEVGSLPYGFNLLHNPFEPTIEQATVDLYINKGVTRISAAAFLGLSLPVVQYRVHGLKRDKNGDVIPKNHVFAKISRTEVARAFMSPPPEKMLKKLVDAGRITTEEAELAREIPMAEDITAEADSGGHTDRRPFMTLLPTILNLREEIHNSFSLKREIRVGAAGGISTPAAVAAAFNMGAAYVVTGTVNQVTLEAGTSQEVKEILAKAEPHDVTMAPAADMFEMGVKLQVLKFGTMFPMRADKLFALYQKYSSIEEVPEKDRQQLEKQFFRRPINEIWTDTEKFFNKRDPSQIEKAKKNPKHKMALLFRWYLGNSSRWAISGERSRVMDYQIWCGPAIGSFNEWRKNSPLDSLDDLHVDFIAQNMLRGAAILSRIHFIQCQGVDVDPQICNIPPRK